ncbi:hypothetical protein [Nonomuraea bangladeshensis]|uniref:hypothetical protein n=1 Tax=Nonomuraea bangladeshensis TaxID=404385 RepID=UPI003C307491
MHALDLTAAHPDGGGDGLVTVLVGGLGGFLPPLVMGFLYGRLGSYSLGLALLAISPRSPWP